MTARDVLDEQIRYYRERAPEYDDAYRGNSEEWDSEFLKLVEAFDRADLRGAVLELGAGTGYWTERLVRRGLSVTAIDAAPEALDLNRQRLERQRVGEAADVEFLVVDLFVWRPDRVWESCVAGFWLCKVPDDLLAAHLHAIAEAVRPGGGVFFADKTPDSDTPTELIRRNLHGHEFTIVDRPRSAETWRPIFGEAGFDVEVVTLGPRFTAIVGRLSD